MLLFERGMDTVDKTSVAGPELITLSRNSRIRLLNRSGSDLNAGQIKNSSKKRTMYIYMKVLVKLL
jgi:hypothetical protein